MSKSSFAVRLLINDLARGLHFAIQKWIANGLLGEQINSSLEQLFQRVGKIKVALGIFPGGMPLPEANEKIEIAAARIERPVGR